MPERLDQTTIDKAKQILLDAGTNDPIKLAYQLMNSDFPVRESITVLQEREVDIFPLEHTSIVFYMIGMYEGQLVVKTGAARVPVVVIGTRDGPKMLPWIKIAGDSVS